MNDTVIFLVLAGIALIFRWLVGQASGKEKDEGEEPSQESRPVTRPAAQTEEERIRRFLEALGVPPGTQPPPPVRQRPLAERRVVTPASSPKKTRKGKVRRTIFQPLPPLTTEPPPQPAEVIVTPPENRTPTEEPSFLPPILLPQEQPVPRRKSVKPQRQAVSLGAMLRDPSEVRRAIILREILGQPRGLLALDQLNQS